MLAEIVRNSFTGRGDLSDLCSHICCVAIFNAAAKTCMYCQFVRNSLILAVVSIVNNVSKVGNAKKKIKRMSKKFRNYNSVSDSVISARSSGRPKGPVNWRVGSD